MNISSAIAPFRRLPAEGRRYFPAVLVVVVGAVFSVASFALVRDLEQARIEAEVEQLTDVQLQDLQQTIDVHLDQLHAIRAFFAASFLVERAEFATFIRPQEARHPAIQALEWVPRVTREQRAAFEGAARGEGFPEFAFRELNAQGNLVAAAPRDEYFPVYFVEPLADNEGALGFDVYSDPERRAALEKARDTGSAVATGRIRLVRDTARQPGFFVVLPIYRSGMPRATVDERRTSLHGFAVGVFRIGDLVDDVVGSLGRRGLEVYFFDEQADAGNRFLYHRPLRAEAAPLEPLTEAAVRATSPWAKKIIVADRTWAVLFRPGPEFLAAQRGGRAWVVLLVGLTFTALATAYLVGSHKRIEELRSLAGKVSVALGESVEESSTYVVLKIAFILFMGEGLIMLTLPWQILSASLWAIALIASFLLMVIAAPFIYYWVIRPQMGSMRIALTALGESEKRYRALYDETPSMFLTVAADGTISSANQFGASHFGYAVDELVGNSVLELFADNFRSYARDHLNECLSAPESLHRWEIQTVRKDGTPLWVSETARVVRDSAETPSVLIVCEDITDRKRAQEELLAWRRREAAIFDIADEAIVSVDRNHRIILFNRGAERTFGYAAEEVLGQPLERLIPPQFRAIHRHHVQEFEISGEETRGMDTRPEIVGLRKDGSEFPAEMSVSQVEVAGEKIFTAMLRDITERRQAEEALRRSEAGLANAQRMARLGNWDWDLVTNELYCSDETYRIFGLEPRGHSTTVETFLERIHPDDRRFVDESITRTLFERAPYSVDHRVVHPDGQQRTVHAQGEVHCDDAGNPVRMAGTVQDITDRKEAERALESLVTREICIAQLGQRALANEGLERLFHYATAFVAQVLDVELCQVLELLPDGKNLLLKAGVGWKVGLVGTAIVPASGDSQAGYALLGSEPVIVDELSAESRFSGAPLLSDHGVVSGMTVVIGAPGRPYGVLGVHTTRRRRFTRDDTNFLQAVANVLTDAIERRRAEDAVRDSEERVRLILESTGEAIYGIDGEGKCTFCNPACAKTLGYGGPEDLLGKNMHDVIHHTRPDGTPYPLEECRIYRALTRDEALEVDDELLWRADGSGFPAEIRLQPVRHDGEIVGAVVTFTDITERRRKEAEMIQASKLSTLGEMTTAVAHELNQPLSVIRMAAERVLDMLEGEDVDRNFLSERMARIASQIERAGAIIDHMRIFGRPAEDKKESFDPRETVEKALSLMGEQLRLKDIEVRTVVPETCLPVVGSEVQLEQVLLNLLANARDAIEARFAQLGEPHHRPRAIIVKVASSEAKKLVRISVRDTGGGIPDPLMERIFEPFVTTKEKGKGTGLGLSISRGIVARMGGGIEARNLSGGAQFTITLPSAVTGQLPAAVRGARRAFS